MGAYMQPQSHVQLVTNMIDIALNLQQALDVPAGNGLKETESMWRRVLSLKLQKPLPCEATM